MSGLRIVRFKAVVPQSAQLLPTDSSIARALINRVTRQELLWLKEMDKVTRQFRYSISLSSYKDQ